VSGGSYDVAQICENGHVVTSYLQYAPQRSQKFCEKCGAATISACPGCAAAIPGDYTFPGTMSMESYTRPSFCRGCGAAYPWTQRAVQEFKALAELAEELTPEQRLQLGAAIDDIVADTPRTSGAVARMKLLAPRVGNELWQNPR
jgi:hypothetical protein